ncbi:hypothetical protein HanRHA438_Chr07g0309351 [Helianthus annuus]|uniref:Uncharacterized protein n=1 Tax=Helianthus annuus TaxID=4232 RepID=A0A9K3ILA1_HELAN|nr:hypothetical protein HanXRQr2_Chr07g0299061 [Helianthus annuus]KAJ0550484.1 hypothetical protein HanHA300_Chr07g0245981 [Helianthus annuus]KAJ0557234.1 hypothetical protein HanIR_Chr07g0322861 [Helianthus annuus]KAJ0563442.1 hypothetical protein HanHA89_Chr07g0263201 [Helianthus annuus]KAJ0728779.1 hypothetical protein HanLR1_Chr07g0245561 [Helianthus annuus]
MRIMDPGESMSKQGMCLSRMRKVERESSLSLVLNLKGVGDMGWVINAIYDY